MSMSPTTTHHALILLERDPITGTKLALKSRRSHVSGGNTELNSTLRNWPLNLKSLVGIVGCTFGLGVVYFGYGVGTESPKKEAAAKPSVPVQRDVKKPVRAMNFATSSRSGWSNRTWPRNGSAMRKRKSFRRTATPTSTL